MTRARFQAQNTHNSPFKRRSFLQDLINFAIWTHFRFTVSFRDVEDLLDEWGIAVSNKSIRCWALKFAP